MGEQERQTGETPVLIGTGLGKHFGGVAALSGVDLALYRGEVHALLGANGAGKSTLVKLLAGIEQPDTGEIRIQGKVVRFATPRAAIAAGIATVHQELSLFPSLSVAANILVGQEPRHGGVWIDRRTLRRRAAELLDILGAREIGVATPVAELSLAESQLVEIAKALSTDPTVLILDEPTSALSVTEVERLVEVITRLRAKGTAIVLISHRLAEIERLADRVSILRSGEKVGSFAPGEFNRERALTLMLGESWQQGKAAAPPPRSRATKPLLSLEHLTLAPHFADVSLALHPGEVLGLAGLEGQGQKELLLALFGLFRHGLKGRIVLSGRRLRPRRPTEPIKAGLAFIPDDRKSLGGFLGLSVSENITIAVLERLRHFFLLSPAREAALVKGLMRRLGVVGPGPRAPLGSLSGGNQQKVIVAKWLARRAAVYAFCDPTRGVDAGARAGLFDIIRELAERGSGVLFYSTDISEFPSLCTYVLVFREGRISGALEGSAINEQNILDLSFREGAREAA